MPRCKQFLVLHENYIDMIEDVVTYKIKVGLLKRRSATGSILYNMKILTKYRAVVTTNNDVWEKMLDHS